jgi:predicted Zn-dependent protease
MAAVNSADSDTERPSSLAHSKTDIRTPTLVRLRGYTRTCDVLKGLLSVHFYTFAAERNLWLRVYAPKDGVACTVSKNRYHAREAAAALLKMAKTTSDPAVAAGLIEAAAKLKDQAGELPPPVSVKAPDVQPEGEPPEGAG